jgi:hypothetical protein
MKRFKFLKGIIACLLSLALVLCAFEPTALKADGDTPAENNGSTTSGSGSGSTTADSGSGSTVAAASVTPTYDPATDTVIFSADEKVTFWYAVVGKEEGKAVAGNKFKKIEAKDWKQAGAASAGSAESTSADSTSAENTTDGAYTVAVSFEKAGFNVKVKSNLYVYYTTTEPVAKTKTPYKPNFTVLKTATTDKLAVTLDYVSAYSGSTTCAVATATLGKEKKAVAVSNLLYRASTDEKGKEFGEWKPASELTGDKLAADIATVSVPKTKKKINYQFRVKGTAATSTEAAKRSSDVAKVAVKKQGKAPNVKVDYVKTEGVAIKNGYDYAVVTSTSGGSGVPVPSASGWYTVKPENASGSGENIVLSLDYVPVDKKNVTGNETSFAKEKVNYIKMTDLLGDNDEVYVYVRKSATVKDPAGAASEAIVLKKAEAAPSFSGASVTQAEGKKGALLEIPAALKAGGYEYTIISKTDDITKAKWTKIKSNVKAIEVGKAKQSIQKKEKLTADGNCYIVFRKSAVAKKKNVDGSLASEMLWTTVKTQTATTSTSGSGSGTGSGSGSGTGSGSGSTSGTTTTTDAAATVVWVKVDAPAGENANTKYTVKLSTSSSSGVALKAEDGEKDLDAEGYVKGTVVKFVVVPDPTEGVTYSVSIGGSNGIFLNPLSESTDTRKVYSVTIDKADISIVVIKNEPDQQNG